MFKRIKKFYEDHDEAIIASMISVGATMVTTTAIMLLHERAYKIQSAHISSAFEGEAVATNPLILRLDFRNGTSVYADMLPTGTVNGPPELTAV